MRERAANKKKENMPPLSSAPLLRPLGIPVAKAYNRKVLLEKSNDSSNNTRSAEPVTTRHRKDQP
jgi:hypothetical protein